MASANALAAAEQAVADDVAAPFGLSVRDAAARIVEVVNSNMAQALRIAVHGERVMRTWRAGRLDPAACGAANAPLRRIPDTGAG